MLWVRTKLLEDFSRHFDVVLRDMKRAHRKDLVESFADELLQLTLRQHAAPRPVLLVCLLALAESSLRRR